MLDIKRIRENLEDIKSNEQKRRKEFNLDEVVELDDKEKNFLKKLKY